MNSKSESSGGESEKTYDGYSDYKFVSRRIAETVDSATTSAELIQAMHVEGAQLKPTDVVHAKKNILAAADSLLPELRAEAENVERYAEILEDWEGEGHDEGYLRHLRENSLYDHVPSWLPEFAGQIREVGFELGYLKAGQDITEDEEEVYHDSEIDNLL